MDTQKQVVLKDVHGMGEEFTLLDGVDEEGKLWIYGQRRSDGKCAICGRGVSDGWSCFDDGSVVCNDHVTLSGKIN